MSAILRAAPPVDTLIFGNSSSEADHGLTSALSVSAVGPAGTSLNQPYRYFTPASPAGIYGGSATFTLNVDPARRNYFTAKFWGGDDNVTDSTHKGRIYVYVILDGVEYQLGYRHEGDHLASLVNDAPFPTLPGRFFYSTVLLPLWMTEGRSSLTFKVIASGRIYALGSGYEGDGGNYQFNMTKNSRGIYRAYTHVEPRLDPVGETQGTAPTVTTKPENAATSYLGSGTTYHNAVRGQINNRLNNTPSLASSIFNPSGVEFLAYAYSINGQINASQTALPAYQNPAVVTRVRDLLDLHASDYYATPGQVSAYGNGGWGGAYGPLGYAIHLLAGQLAAQLDTSVDYGAGGVRTRRSAWGDMLYASREFGRFNRRNLTNQTLLTDENIYKANLGLLALNDARAFADADAKRYLREACGLEPWRGSDLAGGGSSLPCGTAYYQVTTKGLTREWGYVGANYGEMVHHVASFYRLTGDTAFRDQAVKMIRARAPFRLPSLEASGSAHYRRMAAVGFLAWRGAGESDGNGFGGDTTYGERPGTVTGLVTAAATLDPHAVGYAKQMFAERQFFSGLNASSGNYSSLDGLDVFADYVTVAAAADSGIRLPMTDGQPDFAWADEENGVLALKRGTDRLWIAPYWQAKSGTGINGIARFHYSNGTWDQIGTMETTPRFSFGGRFFTRPARIDKPEGDIYVPPSPPLNAYAGERLPLGASPAGATSDDPFLGKVDFYAFRFGPYLFGMNRTADRSFDLLTPAGFSAATDLFSGSSRSAGLSVPPSSTVALLLDSETDAAPRPATPAWLVASLGGAGPSLEWDAASGAASYTIRRATSASGPFSVIASGITDTTYTDPDASSGTTYHYTVTAINPHGESYPSHVNSIVAASGKSVISFNLTPSAGPLMGSGDRAGAPGVRATRWNNFSGGTLASGIVNAAGETLSGLSVTLSNGNSGGLGDRGGSTGDEASLFRTVLDKYNGSAATLTITGIPHAAYDVYFYVHPDENSTGANDRGGSFTIGSTTYFIRTGSATQVSGPDDYIRATSTSLGTGMNVALGNYVRFENRSGNLTATFTAQNINGGALRLKVAGFQIVGLTASAPASLTASAGTGQITLNWSAVAGTGLSYNVKRATSADGPFTTLAGGLTATSHLDAGAAPGTTYYYQVTTTNSAGQSAPSTIASVTTAPAPPADLSANTVDSNRIDLAWTAAPGATSYTVRRGTSPAGPFVALSTSVTSPAYADLGLFPGQTYYYVVSASGAGGSSSNSSPVVATTLPAAPVNLVAVGGVREIALSWSAASGAASYSVLRSTVSGGPYSPVASALSATSFTDTGLPDGSTFFYVVRPSNSAGDGATSAEASASTVALPTIPQNLAAVGGVREIALSWSAASGAASYSVLRSTVSGGPYTPVASALSATSFTDTGLPDGSTFFYVVLASNSAGNSSTSAEASTSTVALPAIPQNLAAVGGVREIALSWSAASGAASYSVLRSTVSGGPYTPVASALSATSFTDTGLPDGSTFFYVVLASNSAGNSSTSAEASTSTVALPAIPQNLAAVGGVREITLSWSAASGAASYSVLRSTVSGGPYTPVASALSATSFTDTGLPDGSTFFYVVRSSNSAGNSSTSAEASASTVALPAIPQNLAAVGGVREIALSWSAASGAASYSVLRSTVSGGPYSPVASALSATSFTDTGLPDGSTFFYVVRSSNSAGESATSAEASASTFTRLESWRLTHFAQTAGTGDAANEADPDADGLPNLLEYASDTSPLSAASRQPPALSVVSDGTERRLRLNFVRIADPNLRYSVLATSDLGVAWTSIWQSTGAQNITGSVEVIDTVPLAGTSRRFLRLELTVIP